MVRGTFSVTAVLLLAGQACMPDLGRTPPGDTGGPDSPPWIHDQSIQDLGPQPDSGKGDKSTEGPPADLSLTDSDGVPLSGVGGPCPCRAPFPCVMGICRAECTPAGPCGVSASCPATDGCVYTTQSNYACVTAPALPGQPCGKNAWCPVDHLCAEIDSKPAACMPTCTTLNATCGTGGTCKSTSGIDPSCYVCSSL